MFVQNMGSLVSLASVDIVSFIIVELPERIDVVIYVPNMVYAEKGLVASWLALFSLSASRNVLLVLSVDGGFQGWIDMVKEGLRSIEQK